eukprot:scaffold9468_cov130-Skeletonema_dohrnii-CCMP3373.AAC.1
MVEVSWGWMARKSAAVVILLLLLLLRKIIFVVGSVQIAHRRNSNVPVGSGPLTKLWRERAFRSDSGVFFYVDFVQYQSSTYGASERKDTRLCHFEQQGSSTLWKRK